MDSREATCKILALMEEEQKIISILLGELSLQHKDSTSHNQYVALSQVLQNQRDVLISLPCVKKFRDARQIVLDADGQVHGSIDPEGLDLTLSINLLRHIDGLIPNGIGASCFPCGSTTHVECQCKKRHSCRKNKHKDVYGKHPGWGSHHECIDCIRGVRSQGWYLYSIFTISLKKVSLKKVFLY